jgi:DeoR/GlpR family transcriptional regulator of sugar metabolism
MSPRLYRQERHEQIIELVERNGRVSVAALSERFDLSKATIRSDLEDLVKQGLIVRTHGGAISSDYANIEMSFDVRRRLNEPQKRRIGAAAAAMIGDGEAIALDASTTAMAIAEQLGGQRELTIITNGILAATTLMNTNGITVLMPGGFLRKESVSLIGTEGRDLIKKYNFQKGFFGAKGFTLQEGLTDVNRDEVAIKRDLVLRAKQVIAVVDSSKWGRVGFASFAAVDELDTVITDNGASKDMIAALERDGIRVIIA